MKNKDFCRKKVSANPSSNYLPGFWNSKDSNDQVPEPLAGEISMVAAAIRLSRTHFCSYVSRWSILSFWWCALVTLPAAIVIVFGYTSSSLALAGNVLLLISTDHRSKKSAENIGFRHLLWVLLFFFSWQHWYYNSRHSVEISGFICQLDYAWNQFWRI